MTADHHPLEATLLAYAAGQLPEGLSLVVATHLAWCDECRDGVAAAEMAAGLLLAQNPPADCSDDLLARTLAALDRRREPLREPRTAPQPEVLSELCLPQPLQRYVQRRGRPRWSWLGPGVEQISLIGRTAGGGTARLLRIKPDMRMPRHGHRGTELAVVLTGAYEDELGRFARGDLADHGEEVTHQPRSDKREGCVCLIATDRPKALAQATARVYRVGLLSTLAPISNESEQGAAFISAMARAGYVLGQNLIVERRGAMGQMERLPALVQELIEARVDVLVVNGYRTAVAAKASGHPTVAAAGTGDAVLTGLVESFARPGGNITGISEASAELSTKRLGLLKELVPVLRRVAMLWNQDDLGMTLRYRASSEAAEKLGVKVQALGVRAPNEFEAAFSAMDAERPDAILMVADSLTNLNRKRVIDFAQQRRLPAIYELAFIVRDGGLMSYGVSLAEHYDRAAALTDRILKGAKPADLPFELPTRFVFAFNMKTARAIGLEPPPMLIARADEVIE